MSQKNKERLYLIYGIVLSALIVMLGICLVSSCITIYKSGDHPFTPESISAQFEKIIIPTAFCLAALVGSVIISVIFPLEEKKLRPEPDPKSIAARLRSRLADKGGVSEEADKIASGRDMLGTIAISLCAASSVPVFMYIFNESSFTDEINRNIISLMWVLIPCAVFAFSVGVFFSFYSKSSYNKEIAELKKALAAAAENTVAEKPIAVASKKESHSLAAVRAIVFAVAVVFIVLGIFNGGMSDVLDKAIKICTECIGLG